MILATTLTLARTRSRSASTIKPPIFASNLSGCHRNISRRKTARALFLFGRRRRIGEILAENRAPRILRRRRVSLARGPGQIVVFD
jgi:hypothetical protein